MSLRLRQGVMIALACIAAILICSEAGFQPAGAGSYPLYEIGDEIKYVPAADQHGAFLNCYAWHFNDRYMGSSSDWTAQKHRLTCGPEKFGTIERIECFNSIRQDRILWPLPWHGPTVPEAI